MKSSPIFIFLMIIGTIFASAQSKVDSSRLVKVLSFNILHGKTTKGDFNLDAIAELIKNADPDFVAMQEVDFKVNRSRKYDLPTELGWRTKMAPLFAKAMKYDGGEYGEGVLSKYSFLQTRNMALPYIPDEEPRAALEVITILPSLDTIAFIGTHFAHEGEPGRVLQAQKINKEVIENIYPTVLAGDLNDVPGSETINLLESIWTSSYNKDNPGFTFPSYNPSVKIDYVMFYPKHRWQVIDTKIIANTYVSDHCAYLVTLELLEE